MSDRSYIEKIPTEQIDEGERQRKEYKNIDKLAADIKKIGRLINPITVQALEDGKYLLVAGGRRLLAHEELGWKEIEARIWPADMSDLEKEMVELLENVSRENLTWQERVEAEEKILRLQKKLSGEDKENLSETAGILGRSVSSLSRDMKLAKAAKEDPKILEAKTADQAHKLITKKEEELIKRELVKRMEKKQAEDGIDKMKKEVAEGFVLGNYDDLIKNVPDGCIDLVDLDPPWSIGFRNPIGYTEATGNRGDKMRNENLDAYIDRDAKEYPQLARGYAKEAYRVLKDDGWLVFWCSPSSWTPTLEAMQEAGFDVYHPAIWTKPGQGRNNNPSFRCTVDYEIFIYGRKGKAQLNKQGRSSLYQFPTAKTGHPNAKPVALQKEVLETFTHPGARILSMFLGSGNILMAAIEARMIAFGFELSGEYRDDFLVRLEKWDPIKSAIADRIEKKTKVEEEKEEEDLF